jgi:dienelactone hydrolase
LHARVPFDPVPLDVSGPDGPVPAICFVPNDAGPGAPMLLFGHGANLGKDDPVMQQIAKTLARWVPAVVVMIDFPAHGERADASWSADDAEAAVQAGMDDPALPARLAREWDAVASAARVHTTGAVGYVGFSMGAVFGFSAIGDVDVVDAAAFIVGGCFDAQWPTPERAARRNALICAGAAKLGTREVLMCNMTRDEHFPLAAALDLFALIPGPKRMHVFEGTHWDVPSEAVRSAADFFRRTLAS